MKPTTEQSACVDHFNTGRTLKINAYAGTGKTSTLKLLSRATTRRGVYLAFNSSIAKEAAREFPRNVSCSTVHGLAFQAMKVKYSTDKMTRNIGAGYVAASLGLKGRTFEIGKGEWVQLSPRGYGFVIGETVKRWLRSGDDGVTESHVPLDGKLANAKGEYRGEMVKDVARAARRLFDRMREPRDSMPLTHDGYLKLWALQLPQLAADFVLLDEAQDTNGVVLALMQHQPGQIICVGDKHQAIYEWRGARNAMVELPSDATARLTTSFRFGQAIADNATAVLRLLGETVPLRGNPERASTIGAIEAPDAILCRTNAHLIAGVVSEVENDRKPFVVGGVNEVVSYVEAAEKLMSPGCAGVEMPLDFFGFADWHQVQQASEQEDGADLRRWVKLFDDYGTSQLREMLESLPTREDDADVVYSTGHKSKGREWPRIRLTDDFLKGIGEDKSTGNKPKAEDHAAELRLYYVAVTRGRDALDVPAALTSKLRMIEAAPALTEEEPRTPARITIVSTPTFKVDPLTREFEAIDLDAPAATVCDQSPEKGPTNPADEFEAIDYDAPAKLAVPAEAKPARRGRKTKPENIDAKKYPNRLVKCACPSCGYPVHTTRKWIKVGLPNCPVDNVPLVPAA